VTTSPDRRRWTTDATRLAGGLAGIAAVTVIFRLWAGVSNPTIAALTFLLIVLIVASTSRLWVAFATALAAMFAFNYYFLPPVGTLTIADPQNWVALFVFLAVSVIASNLSTAARARALEAQNRRDELARLFDLSRDILVMTDSHALSGLARSVATRFALDYVALALPHGDTWDVFDAGALQVTLAPELLSETFAGITGTLQFDARARTYGGHTTQSVGGETIRLVPLRLGTRPTGLLATAGRPVEPGTLDVLGGIVAIAVERARFLDERKTAELTRQSEELKSALLASIGHDLRTPLTAIRVSASNLRDSWLGEADRRDQADVILTEVERLTRLFQNILSMAKIDAGPIATTVEWAVPSDIVAAAREQVEQTLRLHKLEVSIPSDAPVRLDPRLMATAVAHVLENAAQYSPPGATIKVTASVVDGDLRVTVHDAGPGISPADLPRLFERFYRGEAARTRGSGTGMGLAIARGLLAAEGGRIWAENNPAGGAMFTIAVPVDQRAEPAVTS
jgi:two-component system sensor histidine kinase KdpD